MRCFRIASRTWFRKKSRKSGAQKAALWRRSSSTAVPPHFRHFIGVGSARPASLGGWPERSEEHTSELQSHSDLVCRLLLEKKKYKQKANLPDSIRQEP